MDRYFSGYLHNCSDTESSEIQAPAFLPSPITKKCTILLAFPKGEKWAWQVGSSPAKSLSYLLTLEEAHYGI